MAVVRSRGGNQAAERAEGAENTTIPATPFKMALMWQKVEENKENEEGRVHIPMINILLNDKETLKSPDRQYNIVTYRYIHNLHGKGGILHRLLC